MTCLLRCALNAVSGAPTISSSSSFSSSSKKQSLSLGRKSRKIFVSKNDDAKVNDDDDEEILSETTKRIAEQIASRRTTENEGGEKAFGAGGQTTVDSLKRVDGIWKRIKSSEGKTRSVREFVKTTTTVEEDEGEGKRKFDVVVCGGTLGILLAATLQQKENNLKVLKSLKV